MHFAWSFPIQMMSIYWVVIQWAGVRLVVMSHRLEAARPNINISMTWTLKFDKHKCRDSYKMSKQSKNYELISRLMNRFSHENWPLSLFAVKVSQLSFIMGNRTNRSIFSWYVTRQAYMHLYNKSYMMVTRGLYATTGNTSKTKERGRSCVYTWK